MKKMGVAECCVVGYACTMYCDLEKEFVGMSSIIEENLTILTKKDVLFATKPWKL